MSHSSLSPTVLAQQISSHTPPSSNTRPPWALESKMDRDPCPGVLLHHWAKQRLAKAFKKFAWSETGGLFRLPSPQPGKSSRSCNPSAPQPTFSRREEISRLGARETLKNPKAGLHRILTTLSWQVFSKGQGYGKGVFQCFPSFLPLGSSKLWNTLACVLAISLSTPIPSWAQTVSRNIKVCNYLNLNRTLSVALGYAHQNEKRSKGWFAVYHNSCKDITLTTDRGTIVYGYVHAGISAPYACGTRIVGGIRGPFGVLKGTGRRVTNYCDGRRLEEPSQGSHCPPGPHACVGYNFNNSHRFCIRAPSAFNIVHRDGRCTTSTNTRFNDFKQIVQPYSSGVTWTVRQL